MVHKDYPVDPDTLRILEKMSQVEGVVKPIVALPDIHYKLSYHTPTGVVALARDRIIPKFVNANCGMSFVTTPFFIEEIDDAVMDTVFNYIRSKIAITTRTTPAIMNDDLIGIVKHGAEWSFERFNLNHADLLNFESEGSLFKRWKENADEAISFIPSSSRRIGLYSFGVLGYGNHFIELQVIDSVINKVIADKFGISKGQICFMLHSDSRAFGQSIIDFYSGQAKKLFGLQQIYKNLHYKIVSSDDTPALIKRLLESTNRFLNRAKSTAYWKTGKLKVTRIPRFQSLEANSSQGRAYLLSTYAAINYGYANRAYLVSVIRDALMNAFKKDSLSLRILLDGNHDSLQKETIDGEDFYVHRNGASRALPPKYFTNHPVFSSTGQPVLLPSSLGRRSFLCAATRGSPASYYSSCHGTGRIIDRGEAREAFKSKGVLEELRQKKIKLYDYGNGYVSEEAPQAFKDVDKVLDVIKQYDIAEPVASINPLAALKGWR